MKHGRLVKLNHLSEPRYKEENHTIRKGMEFHGHFNELPELGKSFWIGCFASSMIQAICRVGKENDTIVIPERFVKEGATLPDVKEGDYLIITYNSLYWLTDVEEARV